MKTIVRRWIGKSPPVHPEKGVGMEKSCTIRKGWGTREFLRSGVTALVFAEDADYAALDSHVGGGNEDGSHF